MKVSVVVVSFNSRADLPLCLGSLTEAYEVIVVDNASTDGSAGWIVEAFPSVRLIANSSNVGFGRACNQGLAIATGDVCLLLNPDAAATPGAIKGLAARFEDPSILASGGRLVFPDGRLQASACRRLTLAQVFWEQTLIDKLLAKLGRSPYWISEALLRRGPGPHEVEQVMGACLMIRPDARFDEDFFLYCEDTELCYRLRQEGKILYAPEFIFEHALGQSSSDRRWWSVAMYNSGKELYFRKHHGRISEGICWLFNRLGALFRMLLWSIALRPGQVRLFWRVLCSRETQNPPATP